MDWNNKTHCWIYFAIVFVISFISLSWLSAIFCPEITPYSTQNYFPHIKGIEKYESLLQGIVAYNMNLRQCQIWIGVSVFISATVGTYLLPNKTEYVLGTHAPRFARVFICLITVFYAFCFNAFIGYRFLPNFIAKAQHSNIEHALTKFRIIYFPEILIHRYPVKSSSIQSVGFEKGAGYDALFKSKELEELLHLLPLAQTGYNLEDKCILEIQFKNNAVYRYLWSS